MLLAIDVGNTNIVAGIFDGEELTANFRMSTDKTKTSDEIGMLLLQLMSHEGIDKSAVSDVIISSVVPPVMHSLTNACRRYIGKIPLIVGQDIVPAISVRIDNPKEVGADRLVNAVAAKAKYGAPLIVVDFGTATTFCAINSVGDYVGGVISSGIKISMDALFEKAAKLPRIEIVKPASVIGSNTVASMQSGAVWGYVGQVEYIVKRVKEELKTMDNGQWIMDNSGRALEESPQESPVGLADTPFIKGGIKAQTQGAPGASRPTSEGVKVVATGGLAAMIAECTDGIDFVDRLLTLEGLRIIYENRGESL